MKKVVKHQFSSLWDRLASLAWGFCTISLLRAQNVGIGISTPQSRLHIHGMPPVDANAGQLRISEAANNRFMLLGRASTYGFIQTHNSQPLAINPLGNNVGIGTSDPYSPLHVSSGAEDLLRLTHTGPNRALILFERGGGLQWDMGVENTMNDFFFGNMSMYVMTLKKSSGFVGIGTVSPGQRLHVAGTIRADNISGGHPASQTYSNLGTNASGDIIRVNPRHGYLFTVVQPCDGTVEGTIRAQISAGDLTIQSWNESGNFHKTCYTLSGVQNARIVLLITNDDVGNCSSPARVSGVRELTVTNGGGIVSVGTDLGCTGSDMNNWTLFIHYNPQ